MKSKLFVLVIAVFGLFAIAGCADFLTQWKTARVQIEAAKAPTTQLVADIQSQIAVLPADDPVRKAGEAKIAKLQATLAKADGWLSVADGMINAAAGNAPNNDAAVISAASVIPYGGLIATLVLGGLKIGKQAVAISQAHGAIRELADDTAASVSDKPWSAPTAEVLTKLNVDTPGTTEIPPIV